jgi:Tol biopolymer transport system component/predicted Ser/Thr protein kinase
MITYVVGQTVSHYRVIEKLGEGGMGVVYKADDTKLRRTVALKFLSNGDAELGQRFLHEAQAAAALHHPNICTVFEIDEQNRFLALEYIEGETLKDRIARRPLKLDEAFHFASQMGQGLRAAHEKGIVHRDIKPANVMITGEGAAKIMDFGLARLSDHTKLTRTGLRLGTPAYMSPEQAEGKAVDRRTDIWSLGVVLYEMVSGRPPFLADSEAAVTHQIVHADPEPLTAVRSGVPMELDRIVGKALAKDPADRYQHVEDMLVDLRALAGRPLTFSMAASRPAAWRTYAPWGLAAVLVVAAALGWFRRPERASPVGRLTIPIPADQDLVAGTGFPFDVSPDGTKLVYAASTSGITQLYLRSIDDFDARPLAGTSGAQEPVFSPDGRSVAFVANNKLLRLSLAGGAAVVLCAATEGVRGMSWGPDGAILYATSSGLWRVAPAGGAPVTIFKGSVSWPTHLPGGKTALVTLGNRQVAVVTLDSGQSRPLLPGKQGTYLDTGHLVYASGDGVQAVRFDASSQQVIGGSVSVLDDVYDGQNAGATYFRVTSAGTLFYVPGRNEHSLVHVSRNGLLTSLTSRRGGFRSPRVSPDARRVAVVIDPPDEGPSDIWMFDRTHGGLTRFTTEAHNLSPVWTPDGQRLVWARQGAVVSQAADGSGKPATLVATKPYQYPRAITPDGGTLIFDHVTDRARDIWAVSLDGSGQRLPLLTTPFREQHGRLSPDGRWLAYASDESGGQEVYVQSFPARGTKSLISSRGGRSHVWSLDGKELFYLEDTRMMAVPVTIGKGFSAGQSRLLFDRKDTTVGGSFQFDVTFDGFIMVQRDPLSMLTEFRVVLNWLDDLNRRAP